MSRPFHLSRPLIIGVSMLMLTVGLAGCGRKGPLDLPPSAAVPGPEVAQQPGQPPAEGAPAPVAPRRSFFLDPLID